MNAPPEGDHASSGRPQLHHGDALAWLAALPTQSVDAVITDPPYSSGGLMRGDRAGSDTREKYTGAKRESTLPNFSGDNRDQRGWAYWMALWLGEALRATKPGGVIAMFTDWRQLPAATDCLQAGGWVERGIVPWIKPDSRPQLGRFTQNAEFVVWGSNGPMPVEGDCLPGYYLSRTPRVAEGRVHITQKPLEVVRSIVRIAPRGGLVIDPFAGSGTTAVACVHEGRRFMGCEISAEVHATALGRVAMACGEAAPRGEQGALDFGAAA
jgi:site-specific DNA-methyltransferase (adenine-specific)